MHTYIISPERGEAFELDAANATDAMRAARARLGAGVTYSIRRADAVQVPPFGVGRL
jgi:hypothetical protein